MANNGKDNENAARSRPGSLTTAFQNYPVLRYVLPLAVGMAAGGMWYSALSEHEAIFAVVAVVAAVMLGAMLFIRRASVENLWFGVTANIFFLSTGTFFMLHAINSLRYNWPETEAAYEGIVYETPKKYAKVTRMRVRLATYYKDEKFHPVSRTIELTAMRSVVTDTIETGDGIMFYAKVSTPQNSGNPYEPDYASYLLRSGVTGTAFAYSDRVRALQPARTAIIISEELSLAERLGLKARTLRNFLQGRFELSGISGENLAVLSALTLGDKHLLERSTRELFSTTGVSHVLALSGLHLAIIYGILQFVFTAGGFARRMRVPAQMVIIAFIWIYSLMAGMPASLVRSAIMYSIVSLGVMVGRKAVTLNNLFLAAFVILMLNPMSLYDIGFQLSFASVFFIVVFVGRITPKWVYKHKFLSKLWGMVAVSVCAQMGVAPLVAYYFGQFPTYFILSNLVVVPLSFLLVAFGLAYLAFSWFAAFAGVLATALKLVLTIMLCLLGAIDSLPAASLPIHPSLPTVVLIYAALFFGTLYLRGKRLPYATAFACCTLAAVVAETESNAAEKNVAGVYFYKGLSCPVVHFVISPQESYIYAPKRYADSLVSKSLLSISRNFWQRCGISQPKRLPEKFNSHSLIREGDIIQFGRQRFYILDSAPPRQHLPEGMAVDLVYVVRGFRGNIRRTIRRVRAGEVVLGERLPRYLKSAILKECTEKGIRYYDIGIRESLKLKPQ